MAKNHLALLYYFLHGWRTLFSLDTGPMGNQNLIKLWRGHLTSVRGPMSYRINFMTHRLFCQSRSNSSFIFAEQTELALISTNPATHPYTTPPPPTFPNPLPVRKVYFSVAANIICIVKQSRQSQKKLATEKLAQVDLSLPQLSPSLFFSIKYIQSE